MKRFALLLSVVGSLAVATPAHADETTCNLDSVARAAEHLENAQTPGQIAYWTREYKERLALCMPANHH